MRAYKCYDDLPPGTLFSSCSVEADFIMLHAGYESPIYGSLPVRKGCEMAGRKFNCEVKGFYPLELLKGF